MIYDPLQHRFFAIGQSAHVLFQIWQPGADSASLVEAAWAHHCETIEPHEIERFTQFLQANSLTLEAVGGGWRGYYTAAEKKRRSILSGMLHTYLFFRIPLFRPEPFLDATLALVTPLGTRGFALFIAFVGIVGLYLVSREWDDFLTTFADVFSLSGAALLAICFPLVKLLHEFGHAYTARFYGCRVPSIGIAVMLGYPMLYADVTDAWRLKSRRQRILIGAAGIGVDLAVACLATFLWAFLPPGPAKSIAFSLATAGWILSLILNLNPFMKFDGYHIAADLLGLDNMQQRAMAMSRWRTRELLFGLKLPPPEPLRKRTARLLALFGFLTWIYRVVLFTGIALAVYAFFFKILGLALFIIEIGYFIILPLWRELGQWYAMRKAILTSRRTWATLSVGTVLVVLMVVPWSSQVSVPAVLEAGGLAQLYPVVPAQVTKVHVTRGQHIGEGGPLVSLHAPALTQEIVLTALEADLIDMRRARRAGDATDRNESVVLDRAAGALAERRDGLLKQQRELELRSPIAGQVVELASGLHVGRWINLKQPLVVVSASAEPVVRGYLDASALWRLRDGAKARFVPDDITIGSMPATLTSISQSSSATIDQAELAGTYGGRVAARPDAQGHPVPVSAQYSIRAALTAPHVNASTPDTVAPPLRRTLTGMLIIEGAPESLLAGLWRQTLKVLIRESGI